MTELMWRLDALKSLNIVSSEDLLLGKSFTQIRFQVLPLHEGSEMHLLNFRSSQRSSEATLEKERWTVKG